MKGKYKKCGVIKALPKCRGENRKHNANTKKPEVSLATLLASQHSRTKEYLATGIPSLLIVSATASPHRKYTQAKF